MELSPICPNELSPHNHSLAPIGVKLYNCGGPIVGVGTGKAVGLGVFVGSGVGVGSVGEGGGVVPEKSGIGVGCPCG